MNAGELEKKFNVSIINWSIHIERPETCRCGHNVSVHRGTGSGGTCDECFPLSHANRWGCSHNFDPKGLERDYQFKQFGEIRYP